MSGLLKASIRLIRCGQPLAASFCNRHNLYSSLAARHVHKLGAQSNATVLHSAILNPSHTWARNASTETGKSEPDGKGNSSWGKWIFLTLVIAVGGGAAIAYQNKAKVEPDVRKKRVPQDVNDIPKEVKYLLIGGGTASFAAFRSIKSHDPKAKVMVITDEYEMPYMRPPLSKEIWSNTESKTGSRRLTFNQWNGVERSIFYEPDDFYMDPKTLPDTVNGGVAVVRGYTVTRLDVDGKKAILEDGSEIAYEKCLIATGSSPKNLDVFRNASDAVKSRVSVFKTVEQYEQLLKTLSGNEVKTIAVVGGGFLGSELSCALAKHGAARNLEVHQIFNEKGNMGKVLPEYLSTWTTERVKEEGVLIHSECTVQGAAAKEKQVNLNLTNGHTLAVDHVIVAVGSEPNTDLAKASKLETDPHLGGYLVNSELLARNSVYAAGDVSNFYDPHLGRRRVEHHDHAVVSGRLAGENMVGQNKSYAHQSMFWSDLGPNVCFEAIGIIDSTLKTVAVYMKKDETASTIAGDTADSEPAKEVQKKATAGADDFEKGVIFYLRDNRIVGVLLWNVFNKTNIARKVIAQDIRTDNFENVARLFNIHDAPTEQ